MESGNFKSEEIRGVRAVVGGGVPFWVPQYCEIDISKKDRNPCSSHSFMCIASWWEGNAAMQLLGNCLKAYSHVRIKASGSSHFLQWKFLGLGESRRGHIKRVPLAKRFMLSMLWVETGDAAGEWNEKYPELKWDSLAWANIILTGL